MALNNNSHSILVLFGITGNLAKKKLIPALFSLFSSGMLKNFYVIGFARRALSALDLEAYIRDALWMEESSLIKDFLKKFTYIDSNFEDERGFERLSKLIKNYNTPFSEVMYYLSTPPLFYPVIVKNLSQFSLSKIENIKTKIIVEKPFGHNLESARALNDELSKYFNEEQIYRIDHYLGKETVQNILTFRFSNSIFENLWNKDFIDFVQITVAEEVALHGRAEFYDSVGALRDMVQNHILQLLSLIAMEVPKDLTARSIHDAKVELLSKIKKFKREDIKNHIVKAQYSEANINGVLRKSYQNESEILKGSKTETFLALKLFINNERWKGIPFYVRTGKSLSRKVSEIYVQFKKPQYELFKDNVANNAIVFRIQPREGIDLLFNVKSQESGYQTYRDSLNFSYKDNIRFFHGGYERLLLDAFLGDLTLYTRRDEIEASWEFITDILEKWKDLELFHYKFSSSGPIEANNVLNEGHFWRNI